MEPGARESSNFARGQAAHVHKEERQGRGRQAAALQLPGARGICPDHVTFMCPWLISVQLKNTVRGAS